MSADSVCTCGADTKGTTTVTANLTGIPLFKSIVRRVRQKISESKLIRSTSVTELPATLTKLDRMSIDDSSSSNRGGGGDSLLGCESRNGYGSDTGSNTGRRPDTRVRIRQKVRSRSKSDSRKVNKKKPKTILRSPPTYVYVRGLSGIPTQRITVR